MYWTKEKENEANQRGYRSKIIGGQNTKQSHFTDLSTRVMKMAGLIGQIAKFFI